MPPIIQSFINSLRFRRVVTPGGHVVYHPIQPFNQTHLEQMHNWQHTDRDGAILHNDRSNFGRTMRDREISSNFTADTEKVTRPGARLVPPEIV